MDAYVDWIYWNLPFMQIQGERVNVVGAAWWILFTLITYNFLRKHFPFEKRDKKFYVFAWNFLLSVMVVKFYHQYVDSIFMFLEVLVSPYMISGNDPSWSWLNYFMAYSMCLVIMTMFFRWFFTVYDHRKLVRFNWWSVVSFGLICTMWMYHLNYYPYDYAVLSGSERLDVYWHTYIQLYTLYGNFYLSLLKIDWKGIVRLG